MDSTTTPSTQPASADRIDRIAQQRDSLKTRHATALSRLMAEREDLRGTHAFADFVDESLRWTA